AAPAGADEVLLLPRRHSAGAQSRSCNKAPLPRTVAALRPAYPGDEHSRVPRVYTRVDAEDDALEGRLCAVPRQPLGPEGGGCPDQGLEGHLAAVSAVPPAGGGLVSGARYEPPARAGR